MRKTLLALVLLAASALPLLAQMRYLPDAPGVWKPWRFVAYPDNQRVLGARAADVKGFDLQLQALNTILKQTTGFTSPVGFSVETVGDLELLGFTPVSGAGQPAIPALPLAGGLNFGAFGVYEENRGGRMVRGDTGETAQLLFFVNQLAALFSDGANTVPEFEGVEADVTRLPTAQPDLFGIPRYGDTLVLKKNPAPVFLPVTLGEAQTLAIRGIERRAAERRDVVARLQGQYDGLKDPKKREQRIAEYKQMAALSKDPQYLDKMMKADAAMEKSADTLLAPIAEARAQVAVVEQELASGKTAAASLPAGERAAPACYVEADRVSFSRFRRAPGTGCVALVRPNWTLFKPALPRSAPQLLTIGHFSGCFVEGQRSIHAGGCAANRRLLESMDKAALVEWLQ